MGVYYDASIAWGLFIPREGVEEGFDLEDVYDLPEGFVYSMGGDHMSNENVAYVLHPRGANWVVLDTLRDKGFGVHAIDAIYEPTVWDRMLLATFASKYNLPPKIGWFAISSVG